MDASTPSPRLLPATRAVLSLTCLVAWPGWSLAQTYQVGDVVEDFELVNRREWYRDNGEPVPAGAPLRLSDFSGKIVLLEWFAFW